MKFIAILVFLIFNFSYANAKDFHANAVQMKQLGEISCFGGKDFGTLLFVVKYYQDEYTPLFSNNVANYDNVYIETSPDNHFITYRYNNINDKYARLSFDPREMICVIQPKS